MLSQNFNQNVYLYIFIVRYVAIGRKKKKNYYIINKNNQYLHTLNKNYLAGPFAHLFHTTREQNFVAYAVAYASKIGPYNNRSSTQAQWNLVWLGSLLSLVLTLYAYYRLWDNFFFYKHTHTHNFFFISKYFLKHLNAIMFLKYY